VFGILTGLLVGSLVRFLVGKPLRKKHHHAISLKNQK
jgi:hypothetical protein